MPVTGVQMRSKTYFLALVALIACAFPASAQLRVSRPDAPPPPRYKYYVAYEQPGIIRSAGDGAVAAATERWCERLRDQRGGSGRLVVGDSVAGSAPGLSLNLAFCQFENPAFAPGAAWTTPPPPGMVAERPEQCPYTVPAQGDCIRAIRERYRPR